MDLTINLLTRNYILEKKVTKKYLLVLFFENLILIPYICGSNFILKKLPIWLLMKKMILYIYKRFDKKYFKNKI
jgi:hypothetical protein